MAEPYIGEVRIVPYTFAPYGWANCDGATLNFLQNQALYALIGTTYGGVAGSTFMLPNFAARLPMGQKPVSPFVQGQTGGEAATTLSTGQLPVHTHAARANSARGTKTSPQGNTWAMAVTGRAETKQYGTPANTPMNPTALESAGTGGAHNNMPPYLVLRFIIAVMGLWPTHS